MEKIEVQNCITTIPMENKQTAVEWFNDEILIHLNFDQRLYLKKLLEQAKEMENNQHKEMFDCGRQFQLTGEGTFKQVHEELYGK